MKGKVLMALLGAILLGLVFIPSAKSIGLTTGFTFDLSEPYPLEHVYVLAGGPGGAGTYEDILLPSGTIMAPADGGLPFGHFDPPGFTVPIGSSGFSLDSMVTGDIMNVYAVLGTYKTPTETHLVIGTGADLTGVFWRDIIHSSAGIPNKDAVIALLEDGGPIGGAWSIFDITEHLHTEGNMAPLGSEIQLYFFSDYAQPLNCRVIANTYGNPVPPPPPQAPSIESCDVNGLTKDSFVPSDTVYVKGGGYAPSTAYDLYVVEDRTTWTAGDVLVRVASTATTITSDTSGNILPTTAWTPGLTPGKYDIVVDLNHNGQYDEGEPLDNNDIVTTAGFFVIPEYWMGAILGLAGCFAALGVFRISKRKNP